MQSLVEINNCVHMGIYFRSVSQTIGVERTEFPSGMQNVLRNRHCTHTGNRLTTDLSTDERRDGKTDYRVHKIHLIDNYAQLQAYGHPCIHIENLIYKSMLRSHLDYCCFSWTACIKRDLETLEKVQKRAKPLRQH